MKLSIKDKTGKELYGEGLPLPKIYIEECSLKTHIAKIAIVGLLGDEFEKLYGGEIASISILFGDKEQSTYETKFFTIDADISTMVIRGVGVSVGTLPTLAPVTGPSSTLLKNVASSLLLQPKGTVATSDVMKWQGLNIYSVEEALHFIAEHSFVKENTCLMVCQTQGELRMFEPLSTTFIGNTFISTDNSLGYTYYSKKEEAQSKTSIIRAIPSYLSVDNRLESPLSFTNTFTSALKNTRKTNDVLQGTKMKNAYVHDNFRTAKSIRKNAIVKFAENSIKIESGSDVFKVGEKITVDKKSIVIVNKSYNFSATTTSIIGTGFVLT